MSRTSSLFLSSSTGRARLVRERFRRGWSQQDLADKLGTTPLNVSRWERRLTTPSPYFRQRLMALFGVTESELDLLPDPVPDAHASSSAVLQEEANSQACFDPAIPLSPFGLPLIGRSRELANLRERLQQPRRALLLALTGLPGAGKTALAIALTQDQSLRATFVDGILWASLGPDPCLIDLFKRWGKLLGVSEREAAEQVCLEDWRLLLCTRMASRRLLLVLDDVWCIEDVLACQLGGPNCAYLLTTRSPRLARQASIDEACAIKELDENQSIELLYHLAPNALRCEPEQIRALVRQVGGLPLALLQVGNYLRLHSYNGQPRRIRTALSELFQAQKRLQLDCFLSSLEAPFASRTLSLSLRLAILSSERQLPEKARAALWALSIFPAWPGSFTEAEALLACQQSVEELDVLSDAGLLESVGEGRYALHQTIVDYGRLKLADRASLT